MAIVVSPSEENPKSKPKITGYTLLGAGLLLLTAGLMFLFFMLWPALEQEWLYWKKTSLAPASVPGTPSKPASLETRPLDENFGIMIPKIEANARVIQDVDWQDAAVYQRALRDGVAHAEGTALPGEKGNVFIFAHSGLDFSEAARYNAVFYLMNKLVAGDKVTLWHAGQPYEYQVFASTKVNGEAIEYLNQDTETEILTLMTCWPAGTTWKRLIVQARRLSGV